PSVCYTLFIIGISFIPFTTFGQVRIHQSAAPGWIVQPQSFNLGQDARKVSEGYYIKLYNNQVHVEKQEDYIHIIREIVSETGIQNGSDIWVNFSPDYQKLTFHKVSVIRNGQS